MRPATTPDFSADLLDAKRRSELSFWSEWLEEHGPGARTAYYREFMMRMGGIDDPRFFENKVCLDLGCGPMGSLTWLRGAKAALGLDPLSEEYRKFGIVDHDMVYLSASAEAIPLPSRSVDVLFSMNSLDHVDDLERSCREIRRVLRPEGHFLGSLNLEEEPTPAEPWTLSEELLDRLLFAEWTREFYQVRPKLEDGGDPYRLFAEPASDLTEQQGPKALWCRFRVAR